MEKLQEPASHASSGRVVREVDRARAAEYALLATLLRSSPGAGLIGRLALLPGDASRLGITHTALAEAAARVDAEAVKREFFALFEGLGRAKLSPYASYYLTGSVYGRPLARLRDTLGRHGIERAVDYLEPEDHAAVLCEIMARLAGGQIAVPAEVEREIFDGFLAPWLGRFFSDLEHAESADFYARVGAVGRTFAAIESEAFTLPACDEVL